ncbi:MAG TPA: ATP-binding cassette domain-containing protein [Nitrolancea sp.]
MRIRKVRGTERSIATPQSDPPTFPTPAVELQGLSKTFGKGRHTVAALREINEQFPEGSFTAIMGPSGSGKSTLIQCAAGLDRPSTRRVLIGTIELNRIKEPTLTITRREQIGFIFQALNLSTRPARQRLPDASSASHDSCSASPASSAGSPCWDSNHRSTPTQRSRSRCSKRHS